MKKKLIKYFLKGIAYLPLWVLYLFSDFIFVILYYIIKYRKDIVTQNLNSAFPEKDDKYINKITKKYYRFLADIVVETIKLFHISDKELHERIQISNPEILDSTFIKNKNAVFLLGHYGNWEWAQEIVLYVPDKINKFSIYRTIQNSLWDEIFKELRSRWGMRMVSRAQAPRQLLSKENQPWGCGFIADQRPDTMDSKNCIEFLNHTTYFICGPEIIGRKVNADFYYMEMIRLSRGKYNITLKKLNPSDMSIPYPYLHEFWKEFEQTIIQHPYYWLWSHNRWK